MHAYDHLGVKTGGPEVQCRLSQLYSESEASLDYVHLPPSKKLVDE